MELLAFYRASPQLSSVSQEGCKGICSWYGLLRAEAARQGAHKGGF